MIKNKGLLENEVVESYNRSYKISINHLSSILGFDYDGDKRSLLKVSSEQLNSISRSTEKINTIFSEDSRVSRVYYAIPSYLDLVDFISHAMKVKTSLDSIIIDYKKQVIDELQVQIPKHIYVNLNIKKILDFFLKGIVSFNDVLEKQALIKQMCHDQADKIIGISYVGSFIADGSQISLSEFSGTTSYDILCRRFLRNEIDNYEGDARISDYETRIFTKSDINSYKVTNIGINRHDCRLSDTSIIPIDGKTIKPHFVSPISLIGRVLKIITDKSKFEVRHDLRIKSLLCSVKI